MCRVAGGLGSGAGLGRGGALDDGVGDVLCVFVDAEDDCRLALREPREPDEVDAVDRADASVVLRDPVVVDDRELDPGEVCRESG